jgi:hypothetical protein
MGSKDSAKQKVRWSEFFVATQREEESTPSRSQEHNFIRKETKPLSLVPTSQAICLWLMDILEHNLWSQRQKNNSVRTTCWSVLHSWCPLRLKYMEFVIALFNLTRQNKILLYKRKTNIHWITSFILFSGRKHRLCIKKQVHQSCINHSSNTNIHNMRARTFLHLILKRQHQLWY